MNIRTVKKPGKALTLALAGVSSLALAPGAAMAQEIPEQERVDDNVIIVTARTFAEDLQDVPIAVSTLSAEDLERQGINTFNDVARKTAGFSFEDFSGSVQQPSIRGQVNLRTTSPVQNVATYIDGIYLQRGYLIDQTLVELDRIEVIKGPQSALYGRNAFAGVINLQTRTPDLDELEGEVTLGIGTDERYKAGAWASVPVIPGKLAILGAVSHEQFDGTWKNEFPFDDDGGNTEGNVGGFNKEAYQVRVLARPIDAIEMDAFYIHTDRFVEAPANYVAGTSGLTSPVNTLNCSPVAAPFPPGAAPENRLFCGELPVEPILAGPNDPRPAGIIVDPRALGRAGPTDIASGKITFNPNGPISARYQIGYVEGSQEVRGNTTRDPTNPLIIFGQNVGILFDSSGTDSEFKAWSHDFRVTFDYDSLYAFFGVSYDNVSDIESNATLTGPVGSLEFPDIENQLFPIGAGLPIPPGFFKRRTFLETDEKIYGFYGFVEYDFTDKFSASVEGRYTIEDRIALDFLPNTNAPFQPLTPPRQEAFGDTFFAPRVTLNYEFTPDNLVYASAAKGVKSGGFNGLVPFVPQRTYEEETNWTYEIGSKNFFRNIGLTLNGSIFYTDWKNIQSNEARANAAGNVPPPTFIVSTVTGNIGDAEIYGAELSGMWNVTENVTFDFGASYHKGEYKDGVLSQRVGLSGNCDGVICSSVPTPTGPAIPIGGNQIERVPEFDGFAGLAYNGEFGQDGTFYIRGDVTYQTKQFVDEINLASISDRLLANAQAGVTWGSFEVNAWVKNLFDKEYVSSAFYLVGTGGVLSASYVPFLGEKRTAGLNVSYRF